VHLFAVLRHQAQIGVRQDRSSSTNLIFNLNNAELLRSRQLWVAPNIIACCMRAVWRLASIALESHIMLTID